MTLFGYLFVASWVIVPMVYNRIHRDEIERYND